VREKGVPEDRPENPDAPFVVPWYHWTWVAPLALLLRLWLATLRFRCNVDRIDDEDGPRILLLWHDKLLVSSWITNRYFRRPVCALISTSKDGGWLVAFFRLMGVTAVRGSSNRRGYHSGRTQGTCLGFQARCGLAIPADRPAILAARHQLWFLSSAEELGSFRASYAVLAGRRHLGP